MNWNVETIGGEAEQLLFMALLGSDGLLTVQGAQPWEGGDFRVSISTVVQRQPFFRAIQIASSRIEYFGAI